MINASPRHWRLALLVVVFGLAACDSRVLDPEKNPMTWTPESINSANIAAAVVSPADLARGHGDPGTDGQQMAAAIHHWRQTPPATFPIDTSDSASFSATSSGSGGGGAPGGSGNGGSP